MQIEYMDEKTAQALEEEDRRSQRPDIDYTRVLGEPYSSKPTKEEKPIDIIGVGNRMMIQVPNRPPIDEFGQPVTQETAQKIRANLGDAPISLKDMDFFGLKPPSENELTAFDRWQGFQKHVEPMITKKAEDAGDAASREVYNNFDTVARAAMTPDQVAKLNMAAGAAKQKAYDETYKQQLTFARHTFDVEEARQNQIKMEEQKYQRNVLEKKSETTEIVKSLAQGVSNGQDAPIAIKNTRGENIHAGVKKAVRDEYPNFDFNMADANYKWKQSATNQRTINFVGGALPRLSALDAQLKELPNVDLNVINRVMATVLTETGKPAYTNYESNRNAIVQEVNTALSGSSQGSDMRMKIELDNLKSARSPEQIRGAIENLRLALEARLDVDLSPLYPIEVVRGEKTIGQYKKELNDKYRNDYKRHYEGETKSATSQPSGKQVVERRKTKDGRTLVKYSDGTLGAE